MLVHTVRPGRLVVFTAGLDERTQRSWSVLLGRFARMCGETNETRLAGGLVLLVGRRRNGLAGHPCHHGLLEEVGWKKK